ncbi:unnamed protein product [Dovyalis caffra]|uniref:PGG domain-containing protein n=1 Tax=Dovyalis caffra TaxID=77055 RepID=A0AAV1R3B9_9ROSI|nr:unnamed protein product [Dovyalis caffra]
MLLTPPSEAGDREIIEILLGAGAMKSRDITLSAISSNQNPIDTSATAETHQSQPNNLVEYFKFLKGRDPPGEAQGTLLVIAVLVATATFQVGVSPPEGVWQDSNIADQSNSTSSNPKHLAGQSILGTTDGVAFAVFVLFNTIGFSVSLCMIRTLTCRLPMQFELQICFMAMFATYNTALINITPDKLSLFVVLTTAILTSTISIVAKLAKQLIEKLRKFTGDTACGVLEAVLNRRSYS